MIINSNTPEAKEALFLFLRMMGVQLCRSEDFQAIGRLNSNGKLIGVVGYNGFTGRTLQIHVAGVGNWVSRELIKQTFHYPFVQLGVRYLFATVAADNVKALRFDEHIGFKVWQTIPEGFDEGIDMIVLKMERDECKWIRSEVRKAA